MRWLPFQLNPDLPDEGIPRADYVMRKFGPGGSSHYTRIVAVGKEVGIDFQFDRMTVQPNTLNAHRLMRYGAQQGREDEVTEALFHAYFTEGANLTDLDVLADVGARAGLERAPLAAWLASGEDREAVEQGDVAARRAGINGVPFFIFNRRIAVSGAHEPDTLLDAMQRALRAGD